MQSPRKGVFSRVSQGLGIGRPSKRLQRDSVPSVDSSGVRRPPVGGGSHADEEDRYPAAQRDQPARVQEGTEGFKAASSQTPAEPTSQPAASEFSEIQPAPSSEDVSGQTVFAAPYKNNAISKLMAETTGPSTTVPPSSNQSSQVAPQQSQHPQASAAAPEPTVPQTESNTERVQAVPGFDSSKTSAQGQNLNTGGFRSSSGVPSEDELAQLYSNDAQASQGVGGGPGGQRWQAGTEVMDMPEDTQIGFSGKGSGIFGSFATPARSARPPAQTAEATQAQEPISSVMQLPESEELRSHRQPEGVATKEADPFTNAAQPSAGQYVSPMPEGETPMYSEAQPDSMSEAVHGPESAASGRFMTPPESPESLTQDPPLDTRVPFHTDTAPQQYVTPTPESAQHGMRDSEQVAAPTEAVGQRFTPLGDSGSYGAGTESGQGFQSHPQMLPSGEGQASLLEGQQDREVVLPGSGSTEQQASKPFSGIGADADTWSHKKEGQSGGQGTQALVEGSQQYPATPDRFSRAPHPASPEDLQGTGSATQGSGSATHGMSQYTPPLSAEPVLEEEPPLGGNRGMSDIPNYPRENPLFDEEQAQQEVSKEAEAEPAAEPVFHDNPSFDQKAANKPSLGSPMVPNRGATQSQGQQGSYESSPQVESHSGFEDPVQYSKRRTPSIDIPPEFDPNNPQEYTPSRPEGGFESARQVTNQGFQPSEAYASGTPAVEPHSVNIASQAFGFGQESRQPELHRQLSEPREIPHEEIQSAGHVTTEPQLFNNGAFEQQETRHGQPYGESDNHTQRQHPSEAVTAANAAVEEEVLMRSEPQAETESNAADDGQAHGQQSFEQPQGGVGGLTESPQEPAIAQAFDVKEPSFSEETVVEEPAPAEEAARERLFHQETVVPSSVPSSPRLAQSQEPAFGSQLQPEAEFPPPRSMLVQEGDPPMGRPIIQSKEATLTAQPPSAAWGSAGGFAPDVQSTSVPFGGVQAKGAGTAGVEPPTQLVQSTVTTETPPTDTVMVDQDPPIDPSVETAPHAVPILPVSTMTGTSTGVVTSTPQLGPASPGVTQAPTPVVTQEIAPAATQPAAMIREDITSNRPAQDPQIDPSEGQAPVVAPRPPPMTTQEIAAYRSGEDPDFDPVERRGWWEVDLTTGGGTILPSNTRGPSRGTGRGTARGQARMAPPTITGPHIDAGGDPSQATHFGSIVPGGTRRQQGAAVRSGGGRGMEQIGAAPGVYDTPPLAGQAQPTQGAGYKSGGLTPTPTPVAPLGQGEAQQAPIPVKPMSTQEVAAYRPAQDPRYDPTEGRSSASALPSALPSAGNDQIDNPLFEEQQQEDISGTEYDQVENLPGQKDVTHRGEQVGTPTFIPQAGPSARGAAPVQQPPQGRAQVVSTGDFSTRPVLGSRRPARTVNLTDIGRPAPAPAAPEPYVAPQPKAEHELGAADVLPQDTHYVKPTPYAELGANARSALSGAGWKTTWAMEMEASQQALKYPVGPVQPKGASGYAPRAAPETVGEPDYAALARGEPGFPTGGQPGDDMPLQGLSSGSSAIAGLPPSVTGATSDLGGGVGPQQGYMQLAPPPVHPGAPVTDRGFTGPGGAAGGARRRLASKLFERQHSLQDPSFDPVSQRFGQDEGYGVELPEHMPANLPTGRTSGRASTGVASEQGVGVGVGGPSRGVSRASSVAGGYPPMPPQYEEEEEVIPEEGIQEEVAEPVDKTKEMNERLLVEVRRRLQAARSQLHTGPPSEADAGSPVDSPLGGRPKVLQGQASSGTPGQYWRTLEEVEAEGSNPMSRTAPSPWVQARGPELVPRRLSYSGGASSGLAPPMRSGIVPSGRVQNKGLDGYSAGRLHNIAGGYPTRRSRGGNVYSWGREGVF